MQPLIRSQLLSSLANVRHAFLANHTPGGRDALDEAEPGIATVKQVHGDALAWAERLEKRAREADGLATKRAGLPVGVYSADCSPILVVSLNGNSARAVMAVHAGWRGTALGIAGKAFAEFAREAGAGNRFAAAIGPCIGFDSFEVGQEVIDAFSGAEERGLARFLREEDGRKKYLFHLAGENARQLRLAAAQSRVDLVIDMLPHCTFRERETLPSYRRDREKAGRILSYVAFEE